MKAPAALPLFGDAYMADTRHFSLAEHGAYLLLLMIAWRSDGCRLPDDDKRIAAMLGTTPAKWNKMKPVVMAPWRLSDGFWTQGRLTKERNFVDEKRAKNFQAATARWEAKPLENNKQADANAYADAMQTQCPYSPTPLLEEEKKDRAKALSKESDAPGFAEFWKAYPRRTAKAAAEKAWPKACQRAKPDAIIAAAVRYAAHPPDDPRFIPHPATWLNQARFEDEEFPDGTTARPLAQRTGSQPIYRRSIGLERLRELRDDIKADAGPQGGDHGTLLAFPLPARHRP